MPSDDLCGGCDTGYDDLYPGNRHVSNMHKQSATWHSDPNNDQEQYAIAGLVSLKCQTARTDTEIQQQRLNC